MFGSGNMVRSTLLPIWGFENFAGREFWDFATCNGGSKFSTLDQILIDATGPISKIQSPGIFIYIVLSFSARAFASGPRNTLGPAQISPIFGRFLTIFQHVPYQARITQEVF